jgi:hypothetical protein
MEPNPKEEDVLRRMLNTPPKPHKPQKESSPNSPEAEDQRK